MTGSAPHGEFSARVVEQVIQLDLEWLQQDVPGVIRFPRIGVWGEVSEIKTGSKGGVFARLRGPNQPWSIQALIEAGPVPAVGDYVRIKGTLETQVDRTLGHLKLRVRGSLEDNKGRARRLVAIDEQVKELQRRFQAVRLPAAGTARRVALVTSARGRAESDFRRAAARRGHSLDIALHDANLVNARSVADAIAAAVESRPDVVVVTRGGGDVTALALFDDPGVVEAVATAASRVPVVVAVGHAEDRCACERVASKRCDTPGAAGALVGSLAGGGSRRTDSAPRDHAVGLVSAPPSTTPIARAKGSSRWRVALIAALLAGVIGFGFGWISHSDGTASDEKRRAAMNAVRRESKPCPKDAGATTKKERHKRRKSDSKPH